MAHQTQRAKFGQGMDKPNWNDGGKRGWVQFPNKQAVKEPSTLIISKRATITVVHFISEDEVMSWPASNL